MKKKIISIILFILSITCFAMFGCSCRNGGNGNSNFVSGPNSSLTGTEIDSDIFDINNNQLTLTLPSTDSVLFEPLKHIAWAEDATISYESELGVDAEIWYVQPELYPDQVYGIYLNHGNNTLTLKVINGEEESLYNVSIYRKFAYNVTFVADGYSTQTQVVEEGAKAKKPISLNWESTVDWDFDFNTPITADTTIFGDVVKKAVEVVDLDYYSIYKTTAVNEEDVPNVIPQPFDYDIEGELLKIAYDEVELTPNDYEYYDDIGFLSIHASVFKTVGPDKVIKIMTSDKVYAITLDVVTFAITSAADLNVGTSHYLSPMQMAGGATNTVGEGVNGTAAAYMKESHWDGYFILANDINFFGDELLFSTWAYWRYGVPSSYWDVSIKYGFAGTLDGRGYALKNFVVNSSNPKNFGWTTLFGFMEETAVVKNLGLINVEFKGPYIEGMFSYYAQGTFENIYLDATLNQTTGTFGVFARDIAKINSLKNCTFILRTGTRDVNLTGLFDYVDIRENLLEGTVLISDFKESTNITACGGKVYSYGQNKLSIELEVGQSLSLDIGNVSKVLCNGVDITENCTKGETSTTIPSRFISLDATITLIGADFAKVVDVDLK